MSACQVLDDCSYIPQWKHYNNSRVSTNKNKKLLHVLLVQKQSVDSYHMFAVKNFQKHFWCFWSLIWAVFNLNPQSTPRDYIFAHGLVFIPQTSRENSPVSERSDAGLLLHISEAPVGAQVRQTVIQNTSDLSK